MVLKVKKTAEILTKDILKAEIVLQKSLNQEKIWKVVSLHIRTKSSDSLSHHSPHQKVFYLDNDNNDNTIVRLIKRLYMSTLSCFSKLRL